MFRRDKHFCHECRFCCSLSVCTNSTGNFFKDTQKEELGAVKNQAISAKAAFEVDMKMFKDNDYRCLKPKKGVSPEKWPHHFMPEFRAAKTEKELKKVKEMPFDINLFNMEDPAVFKRMLDEKKGPGLWRKTYGFDFSAIIEGRGMEGNMTRCRMACLEAEYGDFAKQCKKEGGFFKCCMIGLRWDTFETIRVKFKRMGIIKKGPSEKNRMCVSGSKKCHSCHVTYSCAKQVKWNNLVCRKTFMTIVKHFFL